MNMQRSARERVVDSLERSIAAAEVDPAIFISLADESSIPEVIDESLPLAGMTFAVKDNIDVDGFETTAGCPSYGYQPTRSAEVVRRLVEAGATCIGKTNMDQFATGLVGTRSPYGTPVNPVDPRLIPGGSSSGSAVAVARGLVDFALGTDTAGSGRVPAAHNRIVGLKPTRGVLPLSGVVPAVESIDCVSVFSRSVSEAQEVIAHGGGYFGGDPWSRPVQRPPMTMPRLRVGVASDVDLDAEIDRIAWAASVDALDGFDALELVDVDVSLLVEAGNLLYGGPFVAERHVAVGDFLASSPPDADPVVSSLILGALQHSAVDAYRANHRLAALRRAADELWSQIDVLVVPSVPGVATVDDVAAAPIEANSRLGKYTNWVNLLDQCAVAVPGVDRTDGWPFGVTVIGPTWSDPVVAGLARRIHEGVAGEIPSSGVDIAVVGAHLTGQPLNWQLTDPGGRLVASTKTASSYRLWSLADSKPPKPGLVHVDSGGSAIEVEVWRLPSDAVGGLLQRIPAPLGLGTIDLEDGATVHGFIAEPRALIGATDITEFGGWRAFRAATSGDVAATSSD